jgi:ubiquinone/menaquinone biosynthesis C-methylase UbiE
MNKLTQYYDERAEEYDEIYKGQGPAIPDSNVYKKDVLEIIKIISKFGKGYLIDIGCGTGFWIPYYEKNCDAIVLVDDSNKMLYECKKRVKELGIESKCHFTKGDFFTLGFESQKFDSAIAGFLISHLLPDKEVSFFEKLKSILKKDAVFLFIDSSWSKWRSQYRKKEGLNERILNDGRKFTIYKRYFTKAEVRFIFKKYRFKLISFYFGDAFFAAIGENEGFL